MIQPNTITQKTKYLVESFLLIVFVYLCSFVKSDGLFFAISKVSDHIADSALTLTFPVDSLDQTVTFPFKETTLPANTIFKSVICRRDFAPSEKERVYYQSNTGSFQKLVQCVFQGKSQYVKRQKNLAVTGDLSEKTYTEKYLLPKLNGNTKTRYWLHQQYANYTNFFPYTSIPIRTVEIWADVLLNSFIAICFMSFIGYAFKEERQKILHNLKSKWLITLIITVPIMQLAIELRIRSTIIDMHLPSYHLIGFTANGLTQMLLSSLAEEGFYRAWMIPILAYRFKTVWCVMISSLIFSYSHDYNLISSIFVFISGILYAVIWVKSKSVTLCFVPHALHNLLITFIAYLKAQA
jgi:membrane protease YdiL (CAAX protease family)